MGLEETPEEYVAKMVEVFLEVKRVLRKDGTLWLNIGDSYASKPSGCDGVSKSSGLNVANGNTKYRNTLTKSVGTKRNTVVGSLKPKNLVGIPWRVAFALQADGWWLRSDIIWSKGNPMPESVTDRPTKSHEYIFLLTKSERYFYDTEAIKEDAKEWTGQAATFKRESGKATQLEVPGQTKASHRVDRKQDQVHRRYTGFNDRYEQTPKRNKRSVWNINTKPFSEAHFAVFPPEIPETCIKAGTSEKVVARNADPRGKGFIQSDRIFESGSGKSGNTPSGKNGIGMQGGGQTLDIRRGPCVYSNTIGWEPTCNCGIQQTIPCTALDPFSGSGTTLWVAEQMDRNSIGIELNPDYCEIIRRRMGRIEPNLFNLEV